MGFGVANRPHRSFYPSTIRADSALEIACCRLLASPPFTPSSLRSRYGLMGLKRPHSVSLRSATLRLRLRSSKGSFSRRSVDFHNSKIWVTMRACPAGRRVWQLAKGGHSLVSFSARVARRPEIIRREQRGRKNRQRLLDFHGRSAISNRGFNMPTSKVKEEARKLVDELPDDATWEELEYKIYVRRKIERGLESVGQGDTLSTDEVRRS